MTHSYQWHAPAPLWDLALEDDGVSPARFKQPALLRFDSESFMDRLAATLDSDPGALSQYVARGESWSAPQAGWVELSQVDGEIVKAYQPAHNRFYLVAATLACRQPGLPDRKVDVAGGERVSFVVRRLVPSGAELDPEDPASWQEQAWVGDREAGVWQPASGGGLAAGEEQLALAPIEFRDPKTPSQDDERGARRRLFVGLLPVSGRETYEASRAADLEPEADELAGDPRADSRIAELEDRLLVAAADLARLTADFDPSSARDALLFFLLDLAELMQRDQSPIWDRLAGASTGLDLAQVSLHSLLTQSHVELDNNSWAELLLDAEAERQEILLGEPPPGLLALDLLESEIAAASAALIADGFEALYVDALPALSVVAPPPPNGDEGEEDAAASPAPGVYVVRTVYRRPICEPIEDPVVSEPSRPFELASFFDPDAPARPVQIRLPVDTSIKGLRGLAKGGASFVISKQLRQQLQRLENVGLVQLDDGNLEEGGPSLSLGVIWILSIPIITLCAFILLIIIASLLNIVFWWMPFFKIAIPVVVEGDS